MAFDINKRADVFMTVEGPDTAPRTAPESPVAKQRPFAQSEYDEAASLMVNHERASLFTVLMVLEPARWMAGLWGGEKGGWRDSKTGLFLSFDAARDLIAEKVSELGLLPGLVHSWPHDILSMAEEQQFRRSSFNEKMQRFRL